MKMKRNQKRIMAVILVLVFVFAQISSVYGSNMLKQEKGESDKSTEGPYTKSVQADIVPGKVIVKYKDNTSFAARSASFTSVSAVSGKTDKKLDITELKLADDADVMDVVDKLNDDPNVEFAEPVYVRKAVIESTVVDEVYGEDDIEASTVSGSILEEAEKIYAMIGEPGSDEDTVVNSVYCNDKFYRKGWQWGLQALNMDKLWSTVDEEYQSDIVIAVIDSGVDVDHSEFEGRLVKGYDFINGDDDPDDDYGHGTHVAGIAAAGHDGNGMAGVAPNAKIMPVKVLDEAGFGDTISVVNGILYAVNNGADVINLSFGGSSGSYSEQLAIQYALDNDVVVIGAAGNSNSDYLDYPANYDGVISVGAADWDGTEFQMAGFSNYGYDIDMVAPGVDILSTIPEDFEIIPVDADGASGGGYSLMSGTSMSAPFVAGVAAMYLAYSGQTDIDVDDGYLNRCDAVLEMMQSSAYGFSEYYLANGSMGDSEITDPFANRQLSLSYTLIDDTVTLDLARSDYKGVLSSNGEGDYKVYMTQFYLDEFGNMKYDSFEEAGTISLTEGSGTTEVHVEPGLDYIFFVEGNDDYLSSPAIAVSAINGSFETSMELQLRETIYRHIDYGTYHYYKFTTSPGEPAVYTISSTGDIDVRAWLYDSGYSEIAYDDDSSNMRLNFMITKTLNPDTTYYIKVGTYDTGQYGISVVGGESVEDPSDLSVTVALPEGVTTDESIEGTAGLIEKQWNGLFERYEYNTVDVCEFIILEGTSSATFKLEVPSGKELLLCYGLNFESVGIPEYVPFGFYGKDGACANVEEAIVVDSIQEAYLEFIKTDSIESPDRAFDTVELSGELTTGTKVAEKIDYLMDKDIYKISISESGYYTLSFEVNGLGRRILTGDIPFEIGLFDSEGMEMGLQPNAFIYEGDEAAGVSIVNEFEPGNYYFSIMSYMGKSVDLNLYSYELGLDKASLINCDAIFSDELIKYDATFSLFDPNGNSYRFADYVNSWNPSINMFVPHDSEGGYMLGYVLSDRYEYSEMGYYARDNADEASLGYTVDNMSEAASICANEDKSISLELDFIADKENNSVETSFTLIPDKVMKGTINSRMDEDYYKLVAPNPGIYQISYELDVIVRTKRAKLPESVSLGLLIYEEGKWVQYAEGNKGIARRYFPKGEYYIKVVGDNYIVGPYKLKLNCPPFAKDVKISGSSVIGSTLTGEYTYKDADVDSEGVSTYRWLASDTINGEYSAISGAVEKTYRLTAAERGKYIKFEVSPVATAEPKSGEAVLSSAVGPVTSVSNGGKSDGSGGSRGSIINTVEENDIITNKTDGSTYAYISVPAAKVEALLKEAGASSVNIDVKTGINVENTEISIPAGIFDQSGKAQKSVVIETNNVLFEIKPDTLKLDNTSLNLRLQINELELTAVPEAERNKDAAADDVSMVFDFAMYLGNKRITDFNKPVTITVKYDTSKVADASKLGVYYYNEKDSKWEYVGGKVNADGTITFDVEHFSKYAAMEYKRTFEDIKNHWAKKDIEIILARHITNGVDNKNFKPDTNISRAEFVTMLVRALKLETTSDKIFEDVPAGAWYKEYIQKAYAAGIIHEDVNNRFAPMDFITREQIAEMLVNAYGYASGKAVGEMRATQQIRFKDEEMADNSMRNSITLANALKLMIGNPDGTFAPKGNATRAHIAVTIRRLLQELDRI